MSVPSEEAARPARRRFRWQFGLRTLLGVVLLVCMALAFAHYRRQYLLEVEREQPAIAAIAEIRGTCKMSADKRKWAQWLAGDNAGRVVAVDLGYRPTAWGRGPMGVPPPPVAYTLRERVSDDWMRELAPLTRLETLDLRDNHVSGQGLAVLRNFTELKKLDLTECAIGDDDLAQLAPLKELTSLLLLGTRVGNAGFRDIAALTNLRELRVGSLLADKTITADGLKHIQHLGSLEQLGLEGADLSPVEIEILELLPSLQELDVSNSFMSPAAIEGISRLSGLRELRLTLSGVPAETAAVQKLRAARPGLNVVNGSRAYGLDAAAPPPTPPPTKANLATPPYRSPGSPQPPPPQPPAPP